MAIVDNQFRWESHPNVGEEILTDFESVLANTRQGDPITFLGRDRRRDIFEITHASLTPGWKGPEVIYSVVWNPTTHLLLSPTIGRMYSMQFTGLCTLMHGADNRDRKSVV